MRRKCPKTKPCGIKRWVPYNGYVRQPWPMFIISGLVALAFLPTALGVTLSDYNSILPKEYEKARVTFSVIEKDWWWPEVDLQSELGESSILLKSIRDVDAFLEKAGTDEFYILYSLDENSEEYKINIWYVESSDGEIFVTPEQIVKAEKDFIVSRMWILAIINIGGFIAGNYILCNAPKYHRIAKLLVRKEYRCF